MDAPVRDAYVLMAADTDLFNRWEAGQGLARSLILGRAAGRPDEVGEERFADALGRALSDPSADPAFKALLLALPSESDLAVLVGSRRSGRDPRGPRGPARPYRRPSGRSVALPARRRCRTPVNSPPDAEAAGRRALRNAALAMLMAGRSADGS